MSAIWGNINFNGAEVHSGQVMEEEYKKNCKIDHYSSIEEKNIYIGCGIQHITLEAKNEILPIYDSERRVYFAADCVLDNRTELIQQLGLDNDAPDGTVMYEAYKKYGIDCVRQFRGLFALATYNERDNKLELAVDPVASRCLYYYCYEDGVTFSTLISPIRKIHPDIKRNEMYEKDFLIAPGLLPSISAKETPYVDVYKVLPGEYIEIKDSKIVVNSYFSVEEKLDDCRCRNAKQYGKYFRTLYEKCIYECLCTNGEVAIAMSSGLDSSSIGAIAADFLAEQDKNLYSFTYVPCQSMKAGRKNDVVDETADVMKIVNMHPNIVPQFLNNNGENCFVHMKKGLQIMEIPFKAYVNLPNLMEIYDNAAKNGAKVVLTGQTGNSTVSFGKIDNVLYNYYDKKKIVSMLKCLNNYSKTVRESRKKAIKGCFRVFAQDKECRKQTLEIKCENPFVSDSIECDYPKNERFLQNGYDFMNARFQTEEEYRRTLYLKSMFSYLGELDTKMGLRYGVVIRDATRDIRMLRFCRNLPYKYFAYKGEPRWLIRGNLRDVLPTELLDNWMRYGVQNSDWIFRILRDKEDIIPMLNDILGRDEYSKYLNKDNIEKALDILQNNESEVTYEMLLYLLMVVNLLFHIDMQ